MPAGIQCENCKKFSTESTGWFAVGRVAAESSFSFLNPGPQTDLNWTLCSLKCLVEMAYAFQAIEGN